MLAKALGVLVLLLGPAAVLLLAGYPLVAQMFTVGAVLALQMSLLARPVAGFSILLPVVFGAAAITAQSTDGVAALIVAAAALVGVASSQGYQRGLLAALAATLLGSSLPSTPSDVLGPVLMMGAGSSYGYLLAVTVLRDVDVDMQSVRPQTALSYAALLALLVTVAWASARVFGVPHGWWIPLAVASVGQPALDRSVGRSLGRFAIALLATLVLVSFAELVDGVVLRVVLIAAIGLALLALDPGRRWIKALLVTPMLVLLMSPAGQSAFEYLQGAMLACAVVYGSALLGQWLLWTLRPDPGRVATGSASR
ncbi:MAG: FUSC family protein [Steroidobacteraceae bacterium]